MKHLILLTLTSMTFCGLISAWTWSYSASPDAAKVIVTAAIAACAANPPTCVYNAAIAILGIIIQGINFNHQVTGQADAITARGEDDVEVFHDLGNGTIKNYLDTSALKRGEEHTVWDSKGSQYLATRDAETDHVVLSYMMGDGKVVRREEDGSLASTPVIQMLTAVWNDRGYTKAPMDDGSKEKIARGVRDDFFQDNTHLKHQALCSTLDVYNPASTDEHVKIRWVIHGSGFNKHNGIACGFGTNP